MLKIAEGYVKRKSFVESLPSRQCIMGWGAKQLVVAIKY